jgi:hypothetical protein
MTLEKCPVCKGLGTVPTKCPRCFGSGIKELEHTLFYLSFRDGVTLASLDQSRNVGFILQPGDSVHFDNIYIGKYVARQLKCNSKWYLRRWGKK